MVKLLAVPITIMKVQGGGSRCINEGVLVRKY